MKTSFFLFSFLFIFFFSEISECTVFTVNFENGAIGQIYHFLTQKCLSWSDSGFYLANCNDGLNSNIFQIEPEGVNSYSIIKQNNHSVLLAGRCYSPYYWDWSYYEKSLIWHSNSELDSSFNYSECAPFQCPYRFDSGNNNETCEELYLNETSHWEIVALNSSEALEVLAYALVLKNKALNLCLSSNDSYPIALDSCDESSFSNMFGFKLLNPNVSEINNINTTFSYGSSNLSFSWSNMNNVSDFTFIIYYFDNINDFDGYVCGSDRTNSPISFITEYSNGQKQIRANFTANDLIACHCPYQDDNYNYGSIFFSVKAIAYDKPNRMAISKRFNIYFSRYGELNEFVYVGYQNYNNSDDSNQIIDKGEETVNIDLTKNLTLSFANQKFFNKELNQSWHIALNSESRFRIVVDSLYFYNSYNYFYPTINQNNQNQINELILYVDLSSLTSGFYNFDLRFYLTLATRLLEEDSERLLADNSANNNKAFYSTYTGNQSVYIGTSREIEAFNNETIDENMDYKFILIGVFAALAVLGLVFGIICCFRKRKQENHAKTDIPQKIMQTIEEQEKESIQNQV